MFILSHMKCFAWPHIKVFRFFPICLGNPKKKKKSCFRSSRKTVCLQYFNAASQLKSQLCA